MDMFGNPMMPFDEYGNPVNMSPEEMMQMQMQMEAKQQVQMMREMQMMEQQAQHEMMMQNMMMQKQQEAMLQQEIIAQQQALPEYMQQGYTLQDGYASADVQLRGFDRYGNAKLSIRKLTGAEILNKLREHIFCNVRGDYELSPETQNRFLHEHPTQIDEFPDRLRHACLYLGVTPLDKHIFNIENKDEFYSIPYYFCSCCGKIFYPIDIKNAY